MRQEIELMDYASHILKAVKTGVLVTAKAGEQVNPMTISWGTLGIEWGVPIFTVFIRESRHTKGLLDQNPEFTINIPYGEYDPKILGYCGSKSGRDTDKVRDLGLTLEPSVHISVPGIRQLPLTLECRVIYRQKQDEAAITQENKRRYYPQDVDSLFHGSNRDYHTAYYGQVLGAYLLG